MTAIFVILYMAIADRMRGGFPDDNFWKPNPAPRWKHWLRKIVWYLSGGAAAVYLLEPTTATAWAWCLFASILFAQGSRQNMGVIGWLYPGHPKQLMGWLHQLRIGALWALVTMPLYFVDTIFLALTAGSFFGPILGAFLGRFINPRMPLWCLQLTSQWAWTEFFRGAMMALITVLFNFVI